MWGGGTREIPAVLLLILQLPLGMPSTTDCNPAEFDYDEAMLHYKYMGLQKIAVEKFNCSLTPMDPLIKSKL